MSLSLLGDFRATYAESEVFKAMMLADEILSRTSPCTDVVLSRSEAKEASLLLTRMASMVMAANECIEALIGNRENDPIDIDQLIADLESANKVWTDGIEAAKLLRENDARR